MADEKTPLLTNIAQACKIYFGLQLYRIKIFKLAFINTVYIVW